MASGNRPRKAVTTYPVPASDNRRRYEATGDSHRCQERLRRSKARRVRASDWPSTFDSRTTRKT